MPSSFSSQAHQVHVLIKPNEDCKYEDVVRMLDDMTIADITYYAIVDITAEEKDRIAK